MNDRTTLAQRRLRIAVTTMLATAALAAAVPVAADTAKEKELEARVAELEKIVNQLAAAQKATPPPAATAAVVSPPAKPGTPAETLPAQSVSITPNAVAGTTFLFTGYAKVDALWTQTPDGRMADSASGRDFYVPAQTPLATGADGTGTDVTVHAKQTRLIFGTDTPLSDGTKVSTRFETDFFGSALGNQRSTNTYGLQLRQAYVQWGHWLAGQAWSNFQDTNVLVDSLDYIGATDGTVFVRQAQLRYTYGGFSFSAENPETTITPFHGGTQISADRGWVPDLTAKYMFKGDWGELSLAALARELTYDPAATSDRRLTKFTGAGAISGKLMVGKDDIRYEFVGGNIGRYVGLNFANDAVLTTGDAATSELDTITGYAGLVAYRHVWSPKARSSFYFAGQKYDNDSSLTGSEVLKSSYSITGNFIYSPLPKLEVGAEYRYATTEREDGIDGSLSRLQLSTKYSF